MYTSCLFCHTDLGANYFLPTFPVGRRLAFDPKKGRLWVICTRCGRWNLTPLEERWEAIDESERLYLAGLTLLRQVPSPDKFDIAVGLGGLGVQYAECGHYKAAVRLLERSAALKAAVLAPDHPSVLLAKANLSAARIREPRSRSSPLRCAGDRRPA